MLDLSKDVKAADILQAAEEQKADIINGLSALLTTTMSRMKEVIEGVKAQINCW